MKFLFLPISIGGGIVAGLLLTGSWPGEEAPEPEG